MTDQEFILVAEDEQRDAIRRVCHLLLLLCVDEDQVAYQREITKLANEEDALFCAMVSSAALQVASRFLAEARTVEQRREMLLGMIGSNSTWNLDDLDEGAS